MTHRWLDRNGWYHRWLSLLAAVALALTISVTPTQAHHGWSGYDSTTLLALTGTIVEVQYGNPHVMVTLEVPAEPEEDGTIEDPPALLSVVMAPPFRSESRGLPAEMLVPGTVATYEGYLHRTETLELRAERVTIGDLTVELR
jgi:hypothetical protein